MGVPNRAEWAEKEVDSHDYIRGTKSVGIIVWLLKHNFHNCKTWGNKRPTAIKFALKELLVARKIEMDITFPLEIRSRKLCPDRNAALIPQCSFQRVT